MNLTEANINGVAVWQLEYTFREYYGLAPSTEPDSWPENLSDLLEQIHKSDAMFERYYVANTVQYEEATPETCDGTCHLYHFCAMSEQQYEAFEECIANSGSEMAAVPVLFVIGFVSAYFNASF